MEVRHPLSEKARRDLLLIEKAKTGNQKAFSELMSLYHQSLYHMVLKIVNNAEDAEDITIEAFEKAFKNLGNYEQSFAFSTWLFKIASNQSIDFLRKKRLATISLDLHLESASGKSMEMSRPSEQPDPEEAIIRNQRADLMKKVVDSLEKSTRELVVLRYFKELSYEEIAQHLGMPLGTVKVQLHRAKKVLLSKIGKGNSSY